MHSNSIRKGKLPNQHKEALPFGIHETQLVSGSNLLKRIPAAQRYFESLSQRNPKLAILMLSKVSAEYNRTNHSRAGAHDLEKRERYHKLASRDVQKLMAKGLMADKMLDELRFREINPHFIDAVVRKKAIRLSEIKKISAKLGELEKLNRGRADTIRQRIPHILSRTGVLPRGQSPYEFISGVIDEQMRYAKSKREY